MKITVSFSMEDIHAQMDAEDRRRFEELVKASKVMADFQRGSVEGDRHHFVEICDHVIALGNVIRRARACGGARP